MNRGVEIPAAFARHAVQEFGVAGQAWIDALPGIVRELSDRWRLDVGAPFDLSYGYVAPARRDDTQVVLKIPFPGSESAGEIVALGLYSGEGACQLLEVDSDSRGILLERVWPGETLVALAEADDEAATRIGAKLMRTLWRRVPAGVSLKPIAQWFTDAFVRHRTEYGGAGPLPSRLFDEAERLVRDLLAPGPAEMLLHGDLHHCNVLSAERAPWLAIDPKGVRGDPGYDVGPFLMAPEGQQTGKTPQALDHRLDIFAEELGYDRQRLRAWGIAHAVLSAMWSAENGGENWQGAIAVGEMLAAL